MSILSSITKFFRGESSLLICPRCEKPLADHDEQSCDRRMSRRYFFGMCAGAAGAVIVAPMLPTIAVPELAPSNIILAPKIFAQLVLETLGNNLRDARALQGEYNRSMSQRMDSYKIGSVVTVRKPYRYSDLAKQKA